MARILLELSGMHAARACVPFSSAQIRADQELAMKRIEVTEMIVAAKIQKGLTNPLNLAFRHTGL
jgi:hypothetical protein